MRRLLVYVSGSRGCIAVIPDPPFVPREGDELVLSEDPEHHPDKYVHARVTKVVLQADLQSGNARSADWGSLTAEERARIDSVNPQYRATDDIPVIVELLAQTEPFDPYALRQRRGGDEGPVILR